MRPVIRHGNFVDARDQFTLPRSGLETLCHLHGTARFRRSAGPCFSFVNRSLPAGLLRLQPCGILLRRPIARLPVMPLPFSTVDQIIALKARLAQAEENGQPYAAKEDRGYHPTLDADRQERLPPMLVWTVRH